VQHAPATVQLSYPVQKIPESWVLTEDKVPESFAHDEVVADLRDLLRDWVGRSPRQLRVARNLGVRFVEADPRIGIDPDLCVLEPPPPDALKLGSLRTWLAGHVPPRLCFEIVSPNHPHKDYLHIQDRYAVMGTEELVVFDPLLCGPRSLGGPVLLQRWQRAGSLFERSHFGNDPVYSEVLGAWLLPSGMRLGIADDREGTRPWATVAERGRAEKEREHEQRLALEREVAELRAKLGT
jgi:hypothetical protein